MRHKWVLILLTLSGDVQASDWIRFRPCGALSGDNYQHHELIPAPNLVEILINKRYVVAVIKTKPVAGKSALQCTHVLLANGREVMVVGSYSYVLRRLKAEGQSID